MPLAAAMALDRCCWRWDCGSCSRTFGRWPTRTASNDDSALDLWLLAWSSCSVGRLCWDRHGSSFPPGGTLLGCRSSALVRSWDGDLVALAS